MATGSSSLPSAAPAPTTRISPQQLAGDPLRLDGRLGQLSLRPDGTALTQHVPVSGQCGDDVSVAATDVDPTQLFTIPHVACLEWGNADSEYVVWEEDTDQDFTQPDWTIYSYSFSDHVIRQLATWSDYSVRAPSSNQVMPQVSHGIVIWSAAIGDPARNVVFTTNADGSTTPTTILSDAVDSSLSYPNVAYADVQNATHITLNVLDLVTGIGRTIRDLGTSGALALGGDTVLVTNRTGASVTSITTGETVQLSTAADSQWPVASSELVAWYDGNHSYVYRPSTGTEYELGSRAGANWVGVAGDYVWWLAAHDPAGPVDGKNWDLRTTKVP